MVAVVKLVLLLTAFVSTLVGFKHVDVRSALTSFLHGDAKGEVSSCQVCLAAGKDFCISDGRCITRATYQCKGPDDHITGDKEFALHGNPHQRHSMVCPSDKKFMAKSWDQKEGTVELSEPEQANAWPACTMAKARCITEDGKKVLKGRCGDMWEKCGAEWEAKKGAEERKDVDTKDCYFDKECHDKVDWTLIGKLKEGIFGRLKFWKENKDADAVHKMISGPDVHKAFAEAGMPDDRIDYILAKWVKYVYPDALEGAVEKKNLDKKEQGNSWPMCTAAKANCLKDGEKVLEGRCGSLWEKCGAEWEANKGADEKKNVDTKDCYFDKECHKKVDWTQIGKLKEGIFARLKLWKENKDTDAVQQMIPKVHKLFAEAGMPDDRIDYILFKWVKSVYPDGLEKKDMGVKEQGNSWPTCTIAKLRCMKDGEKVLEDRCGALWEKCGSEWEAHKGAEAKVDVEAKEQATSTCDACLAAGKDFCISGSRCIPRATLQCKGPHDHITGDKEFALHGNPRHQHSMVCPSEKTVVAKAWIEEPMSRMRCIMAKMRCMKDGQKVLEGRCGHVWKKCGQAP